MEVKAKSKYRILNFVFQFIKNTKWHFGYTDSGRSNKYKKYYLKASSKTIISTRIQIFKMKTLICYYLTHKCNLV